MTISPSRLAAAQAAPDRAQRVRKMAAVMHHHASGDGACTSHHLRAAGFTEAEIRTYADDARALLSGRRAAPPSPAQQEAARLVRKARAIRRRQKARP